MKSIVWLSTPARVLVGAILRVLVAFAREIGPEKIGDLVASLNPPPALVEFLAWATHATPTDFDDQVLDHVRDILAGPAS